MIIDDLRLAVKLARDLQDLQLRLRENGDDGQRDKIIRLLEIIRNLDLKQQYSLQKKEFPPELLGKCRLIYSLATRALREVQERNYVPANFTAILERIISLEQEISTDLVLPTPSIRKILNYSPAEAVSRGILFRGVSGQDYQKIMLGEPLFAPNPRGKITITEHILQPGKASDSPFISLTTDLKTAGRFGKVIAINKELLRGHLFTPAEIEADLRRRSPKIKWTIPLRLQRKNSEFLLGNSRTEIAGIPPEAVINRRRLAA